MLLLKFASHLRTSEHGIICSDVLRYIISRIYLICKITMFNASDICIIGSQIDIRDYIMKKKNSILYFNRFKLIL